MKPNPTDMITRHARVEPASWATRVAHHSKLIAATQRLARYTRIARSVMLEARPRSHELAVLAIMKNEGHILEEWIEHYRWQGATRFYLIDNGSTDNTRSAISEYVEREIVFMVCDNRLHIQRSAYNQLLHRARREAQWLLVCDLDEFVYSRRKFSTIPEFLRSLDDSITTVQIPWKIFGSNGHRKQPKEVRTSFVERSCYRNLTSPKAGMVTPSHTNSKYITRTSRLTHLDIHTCNVAHGCAILPNMERTSHSYMQPVSEKLLGEMCLHLNHYAIQSWEYFRDVKMSRGSADREKDDHVRDISYFRNYDINEIVDEELRKKVLLAIRD